MPDKPLVSVIIASYNHAPYIEASIRSVLEQTYTNIELLVVDDGSSDDSLSIIQRLSAQHGFSFIAQANKGLAATLNESIARARGALIAPFGSDDVMLPHRLQTQVEYMRDKPEVGICAGAIQIIDESGGLITHQPRKAHFRRLDFNAVFDSDLPGAPAPTLLFRREALETVGGFDPEVKLEDLLIELKVTAAGYFIDVLETPLALYRKHCTNTYKDRRFMIDNVLKTYDQFRKHPRYPKARARFLNSMLLKTSKDDPALAREILGHIPIHHWNLKTARALFRLVLCQPTAP